LVGRLVGGELGLADAVTVGLDDGELVGLCDGKADIVGDCVGAWVGDIVHVPHSTWQLQGQELIRSYTCCSVKPILPNIVQSKVA